MLKPLGDRVIISFVETEEKSVGGLFLQEQAMMRQRQPKFLLWVTVFVP